MTDVRLWLSPEARFICDVAASAPGTEATAPPGLDWTALVDVLRRHRLELSVGRQIAAMAEPPEETRTLLRLHIKNALLRAMEQSAATIRATEALKSAGLEVLAFKGCVLSQQLHGDPFHRASADVDLLVHPHARAAATAVLGDMGWHPVRSAPDWLDDGAEISFFSQAKGPIIDLHVRLAHHEAQCPLRVLRPFESAVNVMIGGTVVRTLSPEVGLAYLALHATKHLCRKLGWLYDIAVAARVWPEVWPGALAAADRIGADRRLLLTTVLAHQLFRAPADLPESGAFEASTRLLPVLSPILSGLPPLDDAEAVRRVGLWRAMWWDLRLARGCRAKFGVVAQRLRPREDDIDGITPRFGAVPFLLAKKTIRIAQKGRERRGGKPE